MEPRGTIEYNIFDIEENPFADYQPTREEEYLDIYYSCLKDTTLKLRIKNKSKTIRIKKLIHRDENGIDHFVNWTLSPHSDIDQIYLQSLNYPDYENSQKRPVKKQRKVYSLEKDVQAEFSILDFGNKKTRNLVISANSEKKLEQILEQHNLKRFKNTSFNEYLKDES